MNDLPGYDIPLEPPLLEVLLVLLDGGPGDRLRNLLRKEGGIVCLLRHTRAVASVVLTDFRGRGTSNFSPI